MSSFKQLSKADVTSVSYAANKQWALPFSCPSLSNGYFNIYKGTFITGTFVPDNPAVDPITNGQYERLIYDSINHLFYQKFSGSLDTGSLMFNITTYESASQQRPTGAYFDYNTNPLLIKNFPTGANAGIRVLAIDQDIYGSKVLPNSFALSSSAYYIKDDGYGNLYTGSTHVGNIFYAHGLAIITNPDYQNMFPLPPLAYNNIATFLTSDTSAKIIPILQNDISRSCALNTGSVVLSGSNATHYTVNANGTITLNTSTPGNYDVYYTVNSLCSNGCSLTSNKAKVTVNVVQVDPPPCITVEFYGGTPTQNFWFVECGSSTTSSLSLDSTDAPVQRCIEGAFGVSGSNQYVVVGNCSSNTVSSGCHYYLLCAADRAPNAEFYYVTCSGTPVTESLGTSGDCYFDANYRCITGSITLANPYGSYVLISQQCPTISCRNYTLINTSGGGINYAYTDCNSVGQSGSLADGLSTSFCALFDSIIVPDVEGIVSTNNAACSNCASYTLQGSIIATETFLYVTCSGTPVTESGVNSTGVIRCVDPSYGIYTVTGSGTINFNSTTC